MSSSTPSTLAIVFSTGILSLVTGFFLGQGSSLGLFSSSSTSTSTSTTSSSKPPKSWPNSYDVTVHPDSSDEELMGHLLGRRAHADGGRRKRRGEKSGDSDSSSSEGEGEEEEESGGEEKRKNEEGGLNPFEGHHDEEFKLVLVVRADIGMTKGKIAAQCSHATLLNYKALLRSPSGASVLSRWEASGQAKIALQARGGEQELALLSQAARREGLCALVVRDAGRTQVAGGTKTVLGVGPGPKAVVDRVTGALKLL